MPETVTPPNDGEYEIIGYEFDYKNGIKSVVLVELINTDIDYSEVNYILDTANGEKIE